MEAAVGAFFGGAAAVLSSPAPPRSADAFFDAAFMSASCSGVIVDPRRAPLFGAAMPEDAESIAAELEDEEEADDAAFAAAAADFARAASSARAARAASASFSRSTRS